MRIQHIIVVPFNLLRGSLTPDLPIPEKSPEAGIATADRIAKHYDGVGVFCVWVDDETFDASDLEELYRIGDVPDADALSAAA